jgi:diguanylate cyclase (GGDEF)-like protein
LALLFVAALLLVGAIATPLAKDALFPIPGYMLAFGATMVVTNAILASLLLSRGKAEDDASTVLLGATYLFVSLVFLPMTAAFPGALTPGALIGTTMSAVWIWSIWHAGFGLGIAAYSSRRPSSTRLSPRAVFFGVAGIVAAVAAASTWGVDLLPHVFGDPMHGMFSGRGEAVGWALLAIDAAALGLASKRARESSERLWLAVAMVAACFDIWLTFHSGARFSVGWYLGKVGSLATTMVVLVALVNNVSSVYRKMRAAHQALADLAKIDGLTGISNRRSFDQSLEAESRRAARGCQSIALLMVDVDWFKLYNDRYGHQQGDECLRAVAALLTASARRPGDSVARYGGEEFAMLLPATDMEGALLVAERLIAALDGMAMEHAGAPGGLLSLSVGVACGDGGDSGRLVREADQALYRAKRVGRGRAMGAQTWLAGESMAAPLAAEPAEASA